MYKKSSIDYRLLIVTIIITFIGGYMILSTTFYQNIFSESNNPLIDFINDFKNIIIGFILMIIVIFIKLDFIKKSAFFIMVGSLVLLLLTELFGKEIGYSKRWLLITNSFTVQTSEVAKLASIIYFSRVLENINKNKEHYKKSLITVLIFMAINVFFIIKQPDMSMAFVYLMICFSLLFVSDVRKKDLLYIILSIIIFVAIAALAGYRLERIKGFLNASTEVEGGIAQTSQALRSIASGELIGVGAGAAYQTKYMMSVAESDFIFSNIAEISGFLGCVVIIVLYLYMIFRILKISFNAKSNYNSLICVGIASMISLQALIHMGVNTKILPVTGITLPFISSGGSSILIMLISIGLVLNISRRDG